MSLINEALKKAQRQRHENAPASATPGAEGTPIEKRAQPKSATSMLLIVAGAVVLVVASMVGTALWFTRPSKSAAPTSPKAVQATPTEASTDGPKVSLAVQPAPVSAGVTEGSKPVPVAARVSPPPATGTPAATTTAIDAKAATPAAVTPIAPSVASVEPAPAKTEVTPPVTAPKPHVAKPDERIHQFVESLKVAGIRSSGADSKVLMNDRVYRVNDYVDRSLGVRLTKVSSDSLTFTDENGATYVKYF